MRILFVVCISFLVGCVGIKKSGSHSIESFVKSNFSEQAFIFLNSNQTYALCYRIQKATAMKPGNSLEYIIVDIRKREIVFREQKYNANVSWVDDVTIQVKSRPGVRSTDEQTNQRMALYYINVNTLEKSYEYPKQDD